ncbi:hypothetical protein AYI70_g2047 [Smittium culicis]|uniref:Uncharacterized protein n=1 Tax=Smittium culicis TaxID=133412 RepID=A0A1R1YAR2_9FUNG|nr:hypothetical protein AYI70_g2047 [Smittium culicis]
MRVVKLSEYIDDMRGHKSIRRCILDMRPHVDYLELHLAGSISMDAGQLYERLYELPTKNCALGIVVAAGRRRYIVGPSAAATEAADTFPNGCGTERRAFRARARLQRVVCAEPGACYEH